MGTVSGDLEEITEAEVVVAGLACLDITPKPENSLKVAKEVFGIDAEDLKLGQLVFLKDKVPPSKQKGFWDLVGADATVNVGGIVSNTGGSLYKLGMHDVALMSSVGKDIFGDEIRSVYENNEFPTGWLSRTDDPTSFTLVIDSNGEREFLHYPLRNWGYKNIDHETLKEARMLILGYPNLIDRLWHQNGRELMRILEEAKDNGVTTMIDFSGFDPSKPVAKADWLYMVHQLGEAVDIWIPSAEEASFLLERHRYDRINEVRGDAPFEDFVKYGDAVMLTHHMMDNYGIPVVGLKMGKKGLYLRTKDDPSSLAQESFGRASPKNKGEWAGRELYFPAFKPRKMGVTTGAGDALLAGFAYSLLKGYSPEQSGMNAVMTAAECIEAVDTTSAVRTMRTTMERVQKTGPLFKDGLALIPGRLKEQKVNDEGYHIYVN